MRAVSMKRAPVQGHPPAYVIASIYARLSQKDEVFTSLEKAFEQRDFRVTKVNVSFEFDSVRSDPRYAEFLKRIGMPQ
jgi:hypothetical protein